MLQALHDDILLGILQYASSKPNGYEMDLKDQLYLLGIFQRLRAIALPKIYNFVFLNFYGRDNDGNHIYLNKYSNAFAEYIDSNAEIIALANCTHMVKSAEIYVVNSNTAYIEFHNIVEALKSCSVSWPSITKLELDITDNIGRDDPSDSQWERLYCLSEIQCQALTRTFPNVTELDLKNYYSCKITDLYNNIIDAYADQLVNLSTDDIDVRKDMPKLEALQCLTIHIEVHNVELLWVNIHTLVELDISKMPFDFLWASFMDNKDDAALEFPCLKKLSLHYEFEFYINYPEVIDVDKPGLLLNFPVLSSLSIESYILPLSFFKMTRFPKEMEYIYLNVTSSMLAQFKKVGMPTAKKVIINTW